MRKIYIAGGSSERLTVVKSWMDQVRAYKTKFQITHDWTADPGYDAPTKDQGYESALKDLRQGIDPADIVWLIVPEKPSEGQAVELGYAYAKSKHLVISGFHMGRSVFHSLIANKFKTHGEAFHYLINLKLPHEMNENP